MDNWGYGIVALVLLAAAGVVLWNIRRTRRTMETVGRMLDMAMEDTFSEQSFDESRMSALETKFAQYLSASAVSAQNVKIEKDKIKSLIADISHQTKLPISNLLLYCELLEEEDLPEAAGDYVASLHRQAEKLRFLIESLVKLSRLENGILALHPKPGQLQPVLQRVYGDHVNAAEAKGLGLILHPSGCRAFFDPKWTAEALGNIVDNAVKYTERGTIEISAVSYEMFTRIDIADSGMGIGEEEQAKIFSRFYRSETVSAQDGLGLGLHLAREIIAAGGGYIKVVSEPGKGSVFSVFLPNES